MTKLQDLRALIQQDIDSLTKIIQQRSQVIAPSGGVRGLTSLNKLKGRKEGLKMAQKLIHEIFDCEWKIV